jgi:hypothetical protein
VFTWTVRVKGELFTAKFFGAAKLFTAGCGELAGLSSPSVNNFGGTIRLSEPYYYFVGRSLEKLKPMRTD